MSRPGTPTPLPREVPEPDERPHDASLDSDTEHLQRLATLGTLAAGSAHEVNHTVMLLLSSLDQVSAACRTLTAPHPATDRDTDDALERRRKLASALERSQACATRLRDLARGMTECARPATDQPSVLQLNAVVDSALNLVGPTLHLAARLDTTLQRDLPALLGNPAKLSQVVVNLLINASHAVEHLDASEAVIAVSTRLAEGALELRVADNGCGIDPRDLQRALEPFFTTKPPDRGTGLGLAMCRRIVEDHDGDIEITSELGVGTTVTVTLPL